MKVMEKKEYGFLFSLRSLMALFFMLFTAGCAVLHPCKRSGASNSLLNYDEYQVSRAMAKYMTGLLYEWSGSPQLALELYDGGLLNDPDSTILLSRLAILALKMGNTAVAISILEDIVDRYPHNNIAWVSLGDAYLLVGRSTEALTAYKKASTIDSANIRLKLQIAKILFQCNRDNEAFDVLEKALNERNNLPAVLSFCYLESTGFLAAQQKERAAKLFEFIADKVPAEKSKFNLIVGALLADLGKVDEAVERMQKAVSAEDALPEAFIQLATLFADVKKDTASAEKIIDKALIKFPDSLEILFAKASYLYFMERYAESVTFLQKVEAKAKEAKQDLSESFYMTYGSALERSGEIQKAEEVFRTGLEKYPKSHYMLNYLAYMWAEAGINLEEGIELVKKALEAEPENGAYLDTLGWLLFKKGDSKSALEWIQKADNFLKEDPVILEHLGDIYEAIGEKEKAKEAFIRSYKKDSSRNVIKEKLQKYGINTDVISSELSQGKKEDKEKEE